MRYGFAQGKRQLTPYGSGMTDDLGEYRIFGLEPGKYYLTASWRGPYRSPRTREEFRVARTHMRPVRP
jgi:hypothetical protein